MRNITVLHQADDQSAAQRHENGAHVCPCWIMLLYVSKFIYPKHVKNETFRESIVRIQRKLNFAKRTRFHTSYDKYFKMNVNS